MKAMRINNLIFLGIDGEPGDTPTGGLLGNWPDWRVALAAYQTTKPYPRRMWARPPTLFLQERVSGPGGNDDD